MKTISLELPDRLHARIEREAKRRCCSEAEVVREAVEQRLQAGVRKNGQGEARRPTAGELAAELCGSLDGPADLSTNPKYMDGFGL